MHDLVGGAAIARRIGAHAGELRQAGFDLIEFDGYDHIATLATTDVVAPRLSTAWLPQAGDEFCFMSACRTLLILSNLSTISI